MLLVFIKDKKLTFIEYRFVIITDIRATARAIYFGDQEDNISPKRKFSLLICSLYLLWLIFVLLAVVLKQLLSLKKDHISVFRIFSLLTFSIKEN